MDKNPRFGPILIVLIFAVIMVMSISTQAVVRHWESFTCFNEVMEMVLYKGDIWAATKGGLVRIDPVAMTCETYTNVDGLGESQIYCLYIDGQDRLWVGGRGRMINFTDPGKPDVYLFTDRDDLPIEIYDIDGTPEGDTLWLANRAGLTVFLTSPERGLSLILDTYTRLGDIERDTPARRVTLDTDSLWVGTEGGLAVGSRHDIRLLKGPDGWVSFFPSQLASGPDDYVRGLVNYRDTIYVGTNVGPYRFDRTGPPAMINLDLYGNPLVYNMSVIGDSILVNTVRGSAFYYNSGFSNEPVSGMPISNTAAGAVDEQNRYWDGNLAYGIYLRQDQEMVRFDAGGTPSGECLGIVRAQGKIWGAFGNRQLATYESGRWIPVAGVDGVYRDLKVGPLGELWVGIHGRGVYRILGDSIAHYTSSNSGLSYIATDTLAVVVPGIFSTGDAVWFANYRGHEGELVAVNPYHTSQWMSDTLIGGADADMVVAVTAGQGVIYVGSEESGIYALAYNGSPFFKGDDYQWQFTSSNSGIGSDVVNCLAVDGYDTLWVGTSYGLSYQALGETYFINIALPLEFGPAVTTINFDGQGSLYAGSARGLAIRDLATGDIECLNTKNSGLVNDNIHDIYYDVETDALWISTIGGISRLTMPYRLATRDLDNILAYPNPFVIRYGTETVRFNYSGRAEIAIYTLAGELIRQIPINGEWDGRNAAGELVASGVYLFSLTNSEDEVGRGKILVIRE